MAPVDKITAIGSLLPDSNSNTDFNFSLFRYRLLFRKMLKTAGASVEDTITLSNSAVVKSNPNK